MIYDYHKFLLIANAISTPLRQRGVVRRGLDIEIDEIIRHFCLVIVYKPSRIDIIVESRMVTSIVCSSTHYHYLVVILLH